MPDETEIDNTETETPTRPTLPEAVERAIDAWYGTLVESVGPLMTTQAHNVLHESRDGLKTALLHVLPR